MGDQEERRSVQRVKRERNVEGQGKGQEERVKGKKETRGLEQSREATKLDKEDNYQLALKRFTNIPQK